MKRILILIAVGSLFLSIARAQGGGGEKIRRRSNSSVASAGVYIELSRCNACASPRWQQETVAAFGVRGFSAFAGNAKYDDSYRTIQFLEKLPRVFDKGTPVFVGPFQNENAARNVVSQIPSILRKQIAQDQGSQTSTSTGLFEVTVVRVRSSVATGGIDSLPSDAYVIKPGIGIGKALIGARRAAVAEALGAPRYRSQEYDSWQSGNDGLTISYQNGLVQQIEVSSDRFHTVDGVTVATSPQRFIQLFPKSVKKCCGIYGASGFSEWTCWDSANSGIALRRGSHSGGSSLNALIVHSNRQLLKDDDAAECKPCR